MPVIDPPLAKASTGAAITVGAWNSIVSGIQQLDAALARVGRDWVEVSVTSLGRPVPDARVVGIPADPAAPLLPAIAPVGPLRAHTLAGVREGTWTIAVEARGFVPVTKPGVKVVSTLGGPAASISVELERGTVSAPDLLGLPQTAAKTVIGWSELIPGVWDVFTGQPGIAATSGSVLAQAPAGVEVPRFSSIHGLVSSNGAPVPSSRTIVPDFLGWPASRLTQDAATFRLLPLAGGPPGPGMRVVQQALRPGTRVAPDSILGVSFAAVEAATFSAFAGTYSRLADTPVATVRAAMRTRFPSLLAATSWAPWEIARTSRVTGTIDTILSACGLPGPVSAYRDADLEAIWRSHLVAAHSETPA